MSIFEICISSYLCFLFTLLALSVLHKNGYLKGRRTVSNLELLRKIEEIDFNRIHTDNCLNSINEKLKALTAKRSNK